VLIHALDQGQRCGFALGEAGTTPRSGFVEIRQKKEPRPVGHGNLIAYLCQVWNYRKPDLVVYEAPLSVPAWFQSNKARPFPTNAEGVESGIELSALITGCAARFGIRAEAVRRQTILKHMTGSGKQVTREEGKKSVIRACVGLELVEAGCTDDDRCDAVAMFVYASSEFARKPFTNFRLFGQI
jgi:hypothetical protein